jgi:hypothetical protein
MERRWPELFSRPEVQLNLIQQNNTTVNGLSITIAPQEIREIEQRAEPVRQSVRKKFEQYQLSHGNGEGNGDQDASASVSMAVQEKFANYRPPSGNGG